MLKFAIVGCGGMGNWHASVLQKIEGVQVVALCDTVASNIKTYKERYFKDAREYADYDKLLKDEKLDAVVLVTPHTLHYPQAKAALQKGINVLVEKPMVTSSAHAYDLWKLVKKSGKKLGITYQSPYTAEFGYLAKERDAGRLGKVQLVSAWLAQGWLHATKGKWRQEPALSGGGQMYDSGAHMLNALMWLMNDPVVEVACFYDKCGSPVDINGVAIAKFQNGALATMCIGGNCPPFANEIQIQTDKYLIITDQYGAKLELRTNGQRVYPHVETVHHPAAGQPHLNFVRALQGKEPLRAGVRFGVLLSALMDGMYESADKGKPVHVKPVPVDI